jgi:hypothetical protein
MRVLRYGVVASVALLLLVLPGVSEAATTQTFTTSQSPFDPGVRNQGWWSATFEAADSNDNYLVGGCCSGTSTRNFFTFDLSAACTASSVTLRLTRFEQTGPLTYFLYDVSTPASTLNANQGTSQEIFADLGSGTSFGSFPVAPGPATDVLSFPLNPAGVAAFNAARGGFFSIGGQTPAESTASVEFLYGSSGGSNGVQELTVTCLPETKEQCKDGGWQTYGIFKNQGDCVSFVATGGKNPPANSP